MLIASLSYFDPEQTILRSWVQILMDEARVHGARQRSAARPSFMIAVVVSPVWISAMGWEADTWLGA
jgi:hypothetical protein